MKTNAHTAALIESADALVANAPMEAARLYAAAMLDDPASITAHNALETLKAPQAYGRWMHVNCLIDPRDDIFKFFANHEIAKNPIREYLSDGWRTLSELMVILETLDKPLLKMHSVLEFAAGFGRFTRHLVRALPGRVTCADVLPGSIEFLQAQFGAKTILSTHKPGSMIFPEQYELVFVLSMFTHLPPSMWRPWLLALATAVKPGGLLVFSVCNETSAREMGLAFAADGTHFISSSESPSLDADVYGTTYTTRQFVEEQVEGAVGRRSSHYFPYAFWVGQDAVVVQF
ncbi:MAG: class I SAM-dependent methyltransferase [Burkholderiales bacterium]|nr:class I SAM-dependent methyltransferase [Burkholderiales bacterium]